MRRWVRVRRWAGAAAALLLAGSAAARPYGVDDVLRTEGLGQTLVSPDGRWAVLEHRGPYAAGARFDYDRFNDLFRTRILVADLRTPGPPAPLFEHEAGVGYAAGPLSPDSRTLAVFRLKADVWELGLADLAARTVRWTGITPDVPYRGRAVQWLSPRRLAVLSVAAGQTPFQLAWPRPQARLPARWAAAARGETSVSAVGAGIAHGIRPREAPRRLLRLDTDTGARTPLAEGDILDLEAAPDGRRLAVLIAGPDIRLAPDSRLDGESHLTTTRLRLALVDAEQGGLQPIDDRLDVLGQLLAWSPDSREVLVYARADGAAWRDGRLLRVPADGGPPTLAGDGRIRPTVFGRPETLAAGWLGTDPVILGTPAGAGEPPAWWRLGAAGPARLTPTGAPATLYGAAAAGDRLLLRQGGRLVAVDGRGRTVRRSPAVAPPVLPTSAPLPRFDVYLARTPVLAGIGRDEVLRLDARGLLDRWPAPPGSSLLLATTAGALLRVTAPTGNDTVVWTAPGRPPRPLLRLNGFLAEVDALQVRPIHHPGPDGRPLRSWLVTGPVKGDAPPPLVVFPYLNQDHPVPPPHLAPRNAPGIDFVRLLAGHGYAVLVPSLPVPAGRPPTDGLARQVLAIVDAAAQDPGLAGAFDPARLGVVGDSFGAYATVHLITQTDRFRAAVTWAAMPDLVAKWGDFGPMFRASPERGLATPQWVEGVQGQMGAPPWAAPDRYLAGSAIFHLGEARTPLLLGHGELDHFPVAQSEQVFSAYLRQDRDAMLVTYWGEGHRLRSPGNLRDFYGRMLAWLDERLRRVPISQPLAVEPTQARARNPDS